MEMDKKDEQSGRMEEVYKQLHSAYCQSPVTPDDSFNSGHVNHHEDGDSIQDPENVNPGLLHPTLGRVPVSGINVVIAWLFVLFSFQGKNLAK